MSAPTTKQHYGNHSFNNGEATYLQVQIYATVTAMNADAATATGRICYVAATDTFYIGKQSGWVLLA